MQQLCPSFITHSWASDCRLSSHFCYLFQNEKERKSVQNWSLICNELLSRPMKDGISFQLRQNDVSLLCTVYSLPHFNISEEIIHPKSNRFFLRLSSETSVWYSRYFFYTRGFFFHIIRHRCEFACMSAILT